MTIQMLARSVGDTTPPILYDSFGSLEGAVLSCEVSFELQMAVTPQPSALKMPSRAEMMAALDSGRPAIIVPSECNGADPRDLELYLVTWKAEG